MTSSSRAIDLLCRHRRGLGRRARPTRASTASSRTTRRARQLPHALERAARRERARARTPRPRALGVRRRRAQRARARGRRVRRAARRAVFPRGGLGARSRVDDTNACSARPPRGRTAPVVVLVHCNAARDRTGEAIGAWRLRSGAAASAREMYAADVAARGVGDEARPPPAPSPPSQVRGRRRRVRPRADLLQCARARVVPSAIVGGGALRPRRLPRLRETCSAVR